VAEPLVPLMVVTSAFQARVVAARLGADGIPVQLTGSVDGPYPIGTTTLWVLAADELEARGLLLIDEAEWCLVDVADEGPGVMRPLQKGRLAGLPIVLLAIPFVGMAVTSLMVRLG